jgi:hypothetical protein
VVHQAEHLLAQSLLVAGAGHRVAKRLVLVVQVKQLLLLFRKELCKKLLLRHLTMFGQIALNYLTIGQVLMVNGNYQMDTHLLTEMVQQVTFGMAQYLLILTLCQQMS